MSDLQPTTRWSDEVARTKTPLRQLNRRMYKEARDKYGSDGVVFILDDKGKLVVHYLQLKLTSKKLDVVIVFNRWQNTENGKVDSYKKRFDIPEDTRFVYYLIATCPDTGELPGGFNGELLKDLCERNRMDIHILSKAKMKSIWPDR